MFISTKSFRFLLSWKYFQIILNCYQQLTKSQPAFTYLKLTLETLDQGVKYVQS